MPVSPGILFVWYILIILANLIKWGVILAVLISIARSLRKLALRHGHAE